MSTCRSRPRAPVPPWVSLNIGTGSDIECLRPLCDRSTSTTRDPSRRRHGGHILEATCVNRV